MSRPTRSAKQALWMGALLVALLCGLAACVPPTATSSERFTYVVHVQNSQSRQRVAEAELTLNVGDQYSASATSNDDGFATFPVDSAYLDQQATLQVEATGFQSYSENVRLDDRPLPEVVLLESFGG